MVYSQRFVNIVHEKKTGAELAGSWTVEIGEQDEASKTTSFISWCFSLFYSSISILFEIEVILCKIEH